MHGYLSTRKIITLIHVQVEIPNLLDQQSFFFSISTLLQHYFNAMYKNVTQTWDTKFPESHSAFNEFNSSLINS